MKPRTLLYYFGYRPKTRVYGTEVNEFDLNEFGCFRYAQWQHPKESIKGFKQSQVEQMRRYLQPGDVAIDIGAHTGDSTIPLALAVGETGRVLAFEPNPYVYEVLKKNVELNPNLSIEAHPFAATALNGTMEFEYSDPGYCNGGRHEGIHPFIHGHPFKLQVQGRHLEQFLRAERGELVDRIRFIKVDTEGYDATVLSTLSGIIKQTKPVIKVEFYKHSPRAQRKRLYDMLVNFGYEVFRVIDDCDRVGDRVVESNLTQWEHFDVLCTPIEGLNRAARSTGQVEAPADDLVAKS